mmetsp:Transcript_31406/g.53198  ORF Transcript_31406/g.53198 Transcript_31406/m.53198 type:complete len:137 (-) Transcript_31406:281-691(-)
MSFFHSSNSKASMVSRSTAPSTRSTCVNFLHPRNISSAVMMPSFNGRVIRSREVQPQNAPFPIDSSSLPNLTFVALYNQRMPIPQHLGGWQVDALQRLARFECTSFNYFQLVTFNIRQGVTATECTPLNDFDARHD